MRTVLGLALLLFLLFFVIFVAFPIAFLVEVERRRRRTHRG